MTSAGINVLESHGIDRRAFDSRFAVYAGEFDNHIVRERVCDTVRGTPGVASIRNGGDARTVHVMVRADGPAPELGEDFRRVPSSEVPDHVLIQLMMNALESLDGDSGDPVSNAAGMCSVVWRSKGDASDPDQVVTLTFEVRPTADLPDRPDALSLSCRVVTYTNVRFREGKGARMVFNPRRPFETFTQYCVIDGRLAPVQEGWNGPRLIRRGLRSRGKDTRNRVDFLDFESEEGMAMTKASAISAIVRMFGVVYRGIADLKLSSYDMDRIRIPDRFVREDKAAAGILSDGIVMADMADDPERFDRLRDAVRGMNVTVREGGSTGIGTDMICLVPDIGAGDDPYGSVTWNIVQHVQRGSVGRNALPLARSVVKELAIKRDVADGVIRMYDWPSLGFEDDIIFALPARLMGSDSGADDAERPFDSVAVLTVRPDGSTDFAVKGVLSGPRWSMRLTTGRADAIIQHGKDVMAIQSTGLIAVPDAEQVLGVMRANVSEGRRPAYGLKGKELEEMYLAEVTDVNWHDFGGGEMMYYVGRRGLGLNGAITNAAVIRRVSAIEGELFMDRMFDTMCVTFVRSRQTTVLPFPFKYLREHSLRAGYETG